MNIKNLFSSKPLRSFIILLGYGIYAVLSTGSDYLFRYSLNSLTVGNVTSFIVWNIVIFLSSFLGATVLAAITYLFNKHVQEYIHTVRMDLIENYYWGKHNKIHKIQNILTNNFKIINNDYYNPFVEIINNIFVIVMSIGLLFSMHWSLIIVTTLTGITVISLPKITEKWVSKLSFQASQRNNEFLAAVFDWFRGLEV